MTTLCEDIVAIRDRLCERHAHIAAMHWAHEEMLAKFDRLLARPELQDGYVESGIAKALNDERARVGGHISNILSETEAMLGVDIKEPTGAPAYESSSNQLKPVVPVSFRVYKDRRRSFWYVRIKMSDGSKKIRSTGAPAYESFYLAQQEAMKIVNQL